MPPRKRTRSVATIVATMVGAGVVPVVLTAGEPALALAPTPIFAPFVSYDVGSSQGVAIGDFTGDGRADVLASIHEDAALLAQGSDGRLRENTRLPLSGVVGHWDHGAVAGGDVDGDHLVDAAIAASGFIDVFVQRNGSLAAASTVTVEGVRQVDIADVDGDGLADLIGTGSAGTAVLEGRGDGSFAAPRFVSTEWVMEVEVGDVTGDQRPDLVMCREQLTVLAQTADGWFSDPVHHQGDTGCATGLALGDLNADGRTDVAFAGYGGDNRYRLDVLAQRADGTLAPPATYRTFADPTAIITGDANGDSLVDVLTLQPNSATVGVYAQAPDHTLDPVRWYSVAQTNTRSPNQFALGDVNNDQRPDLVVGTDSQGLVVRWGQPPGPSTTTSSSMLPPTTPSGAPTRLFYEPQAYDVSSRPESVAAGDFNGDGRTDVAMSTGYRSDPDNDSKLFVFYQGTDGSLARVVRFDTDGDGSRVSMPVAGDVDGDGRTDLVLKTSFGVDIFLQRSGTFADRRFLEVPAAGRLDLADLDADGRSDMVLTGLGITIYRSLGNGAFGPPETVSTQYRHQMGIGDLDGDGRIDLATTDAGIEVYHQKADGAFAPPVLYPTGGRSLGAMTLGDLTGDGRVDVAVSGQDGDDLSLDYIKVLSQLPAGGLGAPATYPSFQPGPLDTGDVNGDGRNDLVTLYGGSVAGVFLQQPDGQLEAEHTFPLPYATAYTDTGLVVADLNSDGRADVAAADYNHGLVLLRAAPRDISVSAGRYLNRAYQDLLGRAPTAAELANGRGQVGTATGRYGLATAMVGTAAFRARVVTADAQAYLGHGPDPALAAALVDAMGKGSPVEISAVILLGSEEFYSRQGRVPERFMDYLFRQVLGRAPAAPELTAWANLLRTGYNRSIAALTFLLQPQARARYIDQMYQRYLGHPPDAASAGAWLTLLGKGARSELVPAWVVSTEEYWTHATD